MFLSLPFIQIFFPMERSQKSLPMEAIFTINRYSSQDKTKFSFFNNKSEKNAVWLVMKEEISAPFFSCIPKIRCQFT